MICVAAVNKEHACESAHNAAADIAPYDSSFCAKSANMHIVIFRTTQLTKKQEWKQMFCVSYHVLVHLSV